MDKKKMTPKDMARRAEKLMYRSENAWLHKEEIFELLYEAYRQGNGRAAYLLGKAHQEEELTQRDDEAAKKFFHEAAKLGDGYAWFEISSECYDDEVEELSRLRKSAELGCPSGMTYYGEALDKLGHPYKAEEWLLQASEHHEPYANSLLFRHYCYGDRFNDPSYVKASRYALKNKASEYYFSILQIAIIYDFGIGRKKNHKKAREWYLKLEDEPLSKGYLARHYIYGLGGLKKDYGLGFKLLCEGLKEKPIVPLFLFELARCYKLGIGVDKDKKKAKEYKTLWLIHSSKA